MNRDKPMSLVANDSEKDTGQPDDRGVDTSARASAADRLEQLTRLRAQLATGQPIREADVALARRYAEEAHIRARRAHLAAAEQHRRAAQAHDRAAQVHDESMVRGVGDVEAHRRNAAAHRVARDADYRAADDDARLAELEDHRWIAITHQCQQPAR